jgi:hypothetical protein
MHVKADSRVCSQEISFTFLGCRIRVVAPDPSILALLAANFGSVAASIEDVPADLEYSVGAATPGTFSLVRDGLPPMCAANPGDLLYLLEKEITVELQKRRSDLFFLHSAAIELNGKAYLLAADAGAGKSTTTWALLHHDFRYLSDELSPIDLNSMQVFPYTHALCLKQRPPAEYPLPSDALDLGRTIHVPVSSMPSEAIAEPRPLGAVFLVQYRPDLSAPELRAINPAEASARLYLTALNALSHPQRGLDAVVGIAEHVPSFVVYTSALPKTCALIRSTAKQAILGHL